MKITTLATIKVVLEGDETVSPEYRKEYLRRLRQPADASVSDQPSERHDKILPWQEAALRLGDVTIRTVKNYVDRGLLKTVTLPGNKYAQGVLESSVDKLVNGQTPSA